MCKNQCEYIVLCVLHLPRRRRESSEGITKVDAVKFSRVAFGLLSDMREIEMEIKRYMRFMTFVMVGFQIVVIIKNEEF